MMMRRTSPPKHRHDGTSPLPLGMDWSPPPKKWNGRDTVWPHDPRTGWSYCIMIPSWIALPKSRSSASDPVVFYRVQVAIQSPAGVTTTRGVLRRFNDFLKLYSDLKKVFPGKSIPSAPPKGILRMRSKALLEERRCSLEEWMTRLLSDIDISRSVPVASFLELEAAARSSFQEANHQIPEADTLSNGTSSLHQLHATSGLSPQSTSMTSDLGSDTAYEPSEIGTPSIERDDSSDVGIEDLTYEDLINPIEKMVKYGMSNIDEGLLMGESILNQLESLPGHGVFTGHSRDNGNASKAALLSVGGMEDLSEAAEPARQIAHGRRLSNESLGSDLGSCRDSEVSNSGIPNLLSEESLDLAGVAETSKAEKSYRAVDLKLPSSAQIVLPVDQRSKLNRILMIMQRRLVTGKTDMEDLINRLNQEITVKEYLATKVKDLEVELEATRQKGRENLQQALSIEMERVTKMQWDMEELRRKYMEMELRLKSQKDDKPNGDNMCSASCSGDDGLQQELDATREKLNDMLRQHEELEAKSKSDIKVLVKEVKSLRKSKNELQQQLAKSVEEKSEVEGLLEQEKEKIEQALAARRRLLSECETLQNQLQECSTKCTEDGNMFSDPSDDQIIQLISEAENEAVSLHGNPGELIEMDDKLRKMLRDIFVQNAKARKQVSVLVHSALKTDNTHGDG